VKEAGSCKRRDRQTFPLQRATFESALQTARKDESGKNLSALEQTMLQKGRAEVFFATLMVEVLRSLRQTARGF